MERILSFQQNYLLKPLQLGMLLFIVSALLVISCFVLGMANHYSMTLLIFVVSQPLAALVGGLIISRHPRNPVGWFIVAHSLFFTLPEFARQYAIYGAVTVPGSLPFAREMAWFSYWMWAPGILFGFILLPLFFPNGQLISRRWRYVMAFAILSSTLVAVSMAFSPGDYETPGIPNPLGFLPEIYVESWFAQFAQISWMGGMFLAVVSLFVRFRKANAQEKEQIKWIFYAMLLLVIILFSPTTGLFAELTGALSLTLLWSAIGIAVLRYGLYDINIIISRTLVYGSLTAVIVAAYLATAALLGAFIPSGGNLVNALVAAGIVALIFQPLRERLQRSANRLLYGERDEPYTLLTRLGRRLEETLAPDQALPTIVETVATALKLPYVAVALGNGVERAVVAEYSRPLRTEAMENTNPAVSAANIVTIPLNHQRQPLGELRLALRPGEQAFSPADWHLLTELARQVSVSVSSMQLAYDLQHAREALVMAREEERRRLRRDLHDGLGPVLAAQRLKLGSARHFLNDDPALTDRLLAEQEKDLDAALQEVRRLIDNLRPPILDDVGLAKAIERIAAPYQQGMGVQIEVTVPAELPPLPAAVELACYRIVQEALTNVVRHANAHHCWVTLDISAWATTPHAGHTLLLTVTDDGAGIVKKGGNGLGLHSMRARAEELGGTITLLPNRPIGTTLQVRIPLAVASEQRMAA